MDRLDQIMAEHQMRMDEINANFHRDMEKAWEPFKRAYRKLMIACGVTVVMCVAALTLLRQYPF